MSIMIYQKQASLNIERFRANEAMFFYGAFWLRQTRARPAIRAGFSLTTRLK